MIRAGIWMKSASAKPQQSTTKQITAWNECTVKPLKYRHTLVGNKTVDHSDAVGATPVHAQLQLHLHSRLCTWLQRIGQRQQGYTAHRVITFDVVSTTEWHGYLEYWTYEYEYWEISTRVALEYNVFSILMFIILGKMSTRVVLAPGPIFSLLWKMLFVHNNDSESSSYYTYRGYPAKRALSAMRKHGG